MVDSKVAQEIEDLQNRLTSIWRCVVDDREFDAAHERLRRWKERAGSFLKEHVSDEEANNFVSTELAIFSSDEFENLNNEISLYDGFLKALQEEVRDGRVTTQRNEIRNQTFTQTYRNSVNVTTSPLIEVSQEPYLLDKADYHVLKAEERPLKTLANDALFLCIGFGITLLAKYIQSSEIQRWEWVTLFIAVGVTLLLFIVGMCLPNEKRRLLGEIKKHFADKPKSVKSYSEHP